MKTSVELDAQKLKKAKEVAGLSTIREVLDHALDALISTKRRESMADLLGTDFFAGDLGSMRKRPSRAPSKG